MYQSKVRDFESDFALNSWDSDQSLELDVFNESFDSGQYFLQKQEFELGLLGIYRILDQYEERG